MLPKERIAYLSLGSNTGNRRENLKEALRRMRRAGIRIPVVSPVYQTAPMGFKDQRDFYNQAVKIRTALSPVRLLGVLSGIEKDMGRKRTRRWGPRVIDIDILLYSGRCVNRPDLVIPHARMHERNFVLIPLAEIQRGLVHPVFKKRIADLISAEKGRVTKVK